ncbi:MAG: methionine ABC transporter ATP-binding protein [Anaerobutyricum sp.]|nr:methionine ABC transporter ATP-binding protein [Anaerobutyricum sp.]
MSEIVIENLCKTFSTKDGTVEALKNVNLNIESGDIYGIIGMSGAGKSTLVRCINFLEVPTSGKVFINGKSLGDYSSKELRKEREKIGMIFQHFNLLMQKNVLENVCFPLYIQGKSKKEARAKALELLDIVGLGDRTKAYPAQLSGGQKQRVAIARALASDPKILLCDEATSALDPQTTSSILSLLEDINRRFHITIVIITHQMSVVREICSHVAIVQNGEVVEKGTVDEIFTHPKSDAAKELLRNDRGDASDTKKGGEYLIQSGEKIRIVFSENSAFEPVIAKLVLKFNEPVNILKADTKNVGGVAKGEMILEFAPDCTKQKEMKQYLIDRGLEIEEVEENVDTGSHKYDY